MIEPKLLKGFRDFLPEDEIAKRTLEEKLENVFRLAGFVPIDTPALEYSDVLFGKGGGETDKQGYRFQDSGGRDVALRFDLTVPLARFAALHLDSLSFPFKRYHIAKVWRGENTQRGRFREFTQCDFDIIGTEEAGADFEILLTIYNALRATGGGASIHVNHRGLFNRFLGNIGIENDAPRMAQILRIVDRRAKIGDEALQGQLEELLGKDKAARILEWTQAKGGWQDVLSVLTSLAGGEAEDTRRLLALHRFLEENGIAASFTLDPSIARGLDYYTGVVFESFLDSLPDIGSVCSGGRYDNLAGLYCKKRLPGVGSSVGLDRLIAAREVLEKQSKFASYSRAVFACVRTEDSGKYQAAASRLREAGIPCEVFFEAAKLSAQYQSAEKKGIPFVIIMEDSEAATAGSFTVRRLSTRKDERGLSLFQVINFLKEDSKK